MTAERIVRNNIVCDWDKIDLNYRDCYDKSRVVTSTAAQARRLLKTQGWTRPGHMIEGEWVTLDLCKGCSEMAAVHNLLNRPVNTGGRPPKVRADG